MSKPTLLLTLVASLFIVSLANVSAVDLPRGAVQQVVGDLFSDVPVTDVDLAVTCPGGQMTRDGQTASFHFEEVDDAAPLSLAYPEPGHGVTGCGEASYTSSVPTGTEHIHVRFFADRLISNFNAASFPVHAATQFNQSVAIYANASTTPVAVHPFFLDNESGRERRSIVIPTVYIPANTTSLRVVWTFADRGEVFNPAAQDAPQGVAYSSTVDSVTIEYSSVPLPVLSVKDSSSRSGSALIHEYITRFEAPQELMANYRVDLRVRLDPEQQFASMKAPDGTVFTAVGTRVENGPEGYDRNKILQENPVNDPVSQITISTLVSQRFGAGIYEVRTAHTELLDPTAGLIPLAFAFLALPLPFGVAAFLRVRSFEREAFGSFRRAAVRLRWALVTIALYYAAVVLSSFPSRRLDAMVTLPLGADGWILYAQVAIAILAFIALWLVARELYAITKPKELPNDP